MIFTKEWYSIDESVELLNKTINGEILLTRRYIKDLFLEENLKLFIRTSLLSSDGVIFKNGVEIETKFSLFDECSDEEIKSMEVDVLNEKINTNLHIRNEHFYGGGNFSIISDNCHIEDQDNDKFSILVHSFRVFMNKDECKITGDYQDNLLTKNQYISIDIYSEDLVKIDFDDILISLDDLLNAIKFIRNITAYSLAVISDDQQIKELQTQIAEQQAEIDRLKAENEHLRSNQTKAEPNTRTRISAAQRAIFGLLYSHNPPTAERL